MSNQPAGNGYGEAALQRGARGQTALWVIAVLLAFIAGMLATRGPGPLQMPAALAQPSPMVGARGVYAFTGLLDNNKAGLFMLDIEQGTIWCYEVDSSAGARKLRLIAGRSWLYDRYLKDFNCASPTWKTVQGLIDQERSRFDGVSPAPAPDATGGDESKSAPPTAPGAMSIEPRRSGE